VRRPFTIVVLAFALVVPLGASATAAPSPSLRLVRIEPLTVRGAGFTPAGLVTVRVVGKTTLARKRLRAGPLGGFSVTFRALTYNPCLLTAIVATGSSGIRAQLRVRPAQCPPPPPP
jgi:hypothetical protein